MYERQLIMLYVFDDNRYSTRNKDILPDKYILPLAAARSTVGTAWEVKDPEWSLPHF